MALDKLQSRTPIQSNQKLLCEFLVIPSSLCQFLESKFRQVDSLYSQVKRLHRKKDGRQPLSDNIPQFDTGVSEAKDFVGFSAMPLFLCCAFLVSKCK